MKKKVSSRAQAADALRVAIKRACMAHADAMWLNGFRAGTINGHDKTSDDRLFRKELNLHGIAGKAEAAVTLAIQRFARAVRSSR